MHELHRRSIPVLAATSRRSSTVLSIFDDLELHLPALVLDGALGWEARRSALFHERPFSAESALVVLQAFAQYGLTPTVNLEQPELDVVTGDCPSAGPAYLAWAGPALRRVDDLADAVRAHPVYGFAIAASNDVSSLRAVRNGLSAETAEALLFEDARLGGWTLVVSPAGVTKWSGVEAFAVTHGVAASNVLAIGDGDNDVDLLSRSAVSLAMDHGTVAAKAASQHVLEGGIDSWSQVLDFLG